MLRIVIDALCLIAIEVCDLDIWLAINESRVRVSLQHPFWVDRVQNLFLFDADEIMILVEQMVHDHAGAHLIDPKIFLNLFLQPLVMYVILILRCEEVFKSNLVVHCFI